MPENDYVLLKMELRNKLSSVQYSVNYDCTDMSKKSV